MKRFLNIFAVLALAMGFVACEENNVDEGKEPQVVLTADKSEIVADGADSITFTITVDGKKSQNAQIILLNDNSVLAGTTFTTATPGEYRFAAAYQNYTSETVTITATAVPLPDDTKVELKADKLEFMADNTDFVTFTVWVNGEDKTSESDIINITYGGTVLEGNTFATAAADTFEFKAKYDRFESDVISVVAKSTTPPAPKQLVLSVAPVQIKSDGTEVAIFTVKYDEEDVTAKAAIKCTTTGENITDAKFSTTTKGSYSFSATYDGKTSNSVSVMAYDASTADKYAIGSVIDINGTKGVVYGYKDYPVHVWNEDYTEILETTYETYCYVMSLDEEDLQWSTKYEDCNCHSAKGAHNTSDPFDRWGMDINDYPAFKWCMDHGNGWFMPSYDELELMWNAITDGTRDFNNPKVAEFNKILTDNGGEPFNETYYWSSNESSYDMIELVAFMSNSVVCLEPYKDKVYTVRAAYYFKIEKEE